MVVGAAFLDETFAQALLANPRHALSRANMRLAPDDLAPFLRGAASVAELARIVMDWERATGRAEAPLYVPALERRRRVVEPEMPATVSEREAALAA
jgi:hypothetical protein